MIVDCEGDHITPMVPMKLGTMTWGFQSVSIPIVVVVFFIFCLYLSLICIMGKSMERWKFMWVAWIRYGSC